MKKLNLALSLLVLALASPAARAEADDFYKVGPLEVREVMPTAEELYSDAIFTDLEIPQSPLAAIDWGTVTLIGEKVIKIIQAGKPVGNVKRDAVHVLPEGLNSWNQLGGWKAPATKVFSLTAKNYMGITVVDLRLKVSMNYGGSVDGRGRYLANVLVVPTSVYVLWGFNCDVWTEHHDPVNLGTRSSAVAGLGFDIRYRYGSALSEQIGTQDYFVSATGEIKELR